MTAHPQRCETCKNKECDYHYDLKCGNGCGYPIFWEFTKEKGCASHSSQQSEREKVLDRLDKEIRIREDEMNRKAGLEDNIVTMSGYYASAGALNWVRNVLIKSEMEMIVQQGKDGE